MVFWLLLLFVCAALLFRCARVVRAGDFSVRLSQALQADLARADRRDDAPALCGDAVRTSVRDARGTQNRGYAPHPS
jgi:hypothetical protein